MSNLGEKKRLYAKNAIIEAAEELFSRYGYHKTQVMDIVKAVGMSAGTFYHYFKDKRDLFEQIAGRSFDLFRSQIRLIRVPVNIRNKNDRLSKLRETFEAYFDYIDSHNRQFLILLRGSFGVDEEFDVNIWSYYSDIARDLADDIQKWLDAGVIAHVNPHVLACAIVGMAMHLGHSYLIDKKFTREEAVEALVGLSNTMFESYLAESEAKMQAEKKDAGDER